MWLGFVLIVVGFVIFAFGHIKEEIEAMVPGAMIAILGAIILGASSIQVDEQVIEVEEPKISIEDNEIYILSGFVMDGDNWDCNVFRADEAGHTLTKEELSQDDYWVVCTNGDLMVIDEVDYFTSMTKEEYLERTVN